MKVRALLLDDRLKRKVAKVVKYAKQRKNWYDPSVPGWMSKIPGHNPRHQCQLDTFRRVFSHTVDTANTAVVKVIAKLFGFTGSDDELDANFPNDWYVNVKQDGPIDDHCVIVGQDTGVKL